MIAGIVLAAGRSARLGRPKQLLPLNGEPLLRQTLRRVLASSLDEVIVVVGDHADEIRAAIADLPVQIVVNPDAVRGQSTSVQAGLKALAAVESGKSEMIGGETLAKRLQALPLRADVEAAMFLLGDQPGVEAAVIDALIAGWRESKAPVVAPRYNNGMGNPVLFDLSVFPELAALEGDTGARPVVRAHRQAGDLLVVPIAGSSPPDVDTEEDYGALLEMWAKESS